MIAHFVIFLREIVQLLINSIFLYEDGYFDCAFYSIRQAAEAGNNMLYLANKGKPELGNWNEKGYFTLFYLGDRKASHLEVLFLCLFLECNYNKYINFYVSVK